MPRNHVTRRNVLGFLAAGLTVPLRPALAATELRFADLFVRYGTPGPLVQTLTGSAVRMKGYMAPPLKPEVQFFVLTKLPMSTCPFCETEAQWPDDIVVVYTRESFEPIRFTERIEVEGKLETGRFVDEETGFLSLIRIRGAAWHQL